MIAPRRANGRSERRIVFPVSQYEIPDPWPARVRELLARTFVCSWRGHERHAAMNGTMKPCVRCSR